MNAPPLNELLNLMGIWILMAWDQRFVGHAEKVNALFLFVKSHNDLIDLDIMAACGQLRSNDELKGKSKASLINANWIVVL